MADVFVSYARADKARVAPLVAAIEAKGWSVWWDPEISPGQEFDDQIEAEIDAAKAVLVVWTPTSVASRWVRGEAREAAERNILVPVRFGQARLPMDVRAIHTTDLDDWGEDARHSAMQECLRALAAMIASSSAAQSAKEAVETAQSRDEKKVARYSICVLPFANMSGQPEQEYFSDGITEDIITDLSKVSSLRIISRNSAFMYKGQNVDVPKVARELNVTHVLEGSVRKAGDRVRISAQLVDVEDNGHLWAERYDRDADDIFAIQDEISKAIVKALRLRLLPEEKKAIERRGTDSADAHNLYLMARQAYVMGQEGDSHSAQVIVRICGRATEIDPRYAEAWALMALGYRQWSEAGWSEAGRGGASTGDAMAAVERALALNPDLAEAHAVKAQILQLEDDLEGSRAEVATALSLDPESYEVNRSAARLHYQLRAFDRAIHCYEKTVSLMDADVNSAAMLVSCYTAINDKEGIRRSAELALKRAEAVLARDPNSSVATAYSVDALAALGEGERAKARMERALLIDPDNWNMRYNFACMLSVQLKDKDAALAMLEPLFTTVASSFLRYAKADPDLELLCDDPRYQAMIAAAEARLMAEKSAVPPAKVEA
ncbi:MAG TPA: TIR domain-containing protein [Rhodanobacteraceae bacterium]|jgi:adenylate cyclase|nr:TIR domain-containing protein [Rhodanobacteraceae bacterium]